MAPDENEGRQAWELYARPGLLAVSAEIAKDDEEWVLLTLETESESEDGVALATDFLCPECGYQSQSPDKSCAVSELEINAITLKLKIEELPRLITILNEAYRKITSKILPIPEFDKFGEWQGEEWRYADLHLIDPLFSRREPESRPEDLKDRITVLRAYEVISARLSDDAGKLGLLRPIG